MIQFESLIRVLDRSTHLIESCARVGINHIAHRFSIDKQDFAVEMVIDMILAKFCSLHPNQ